MSEKVAYGILQLCLFLPLNVSKEYHREWNQIAKKEHKKWFFRKLDDERLKHNEEGNRDLYSKPSLYLGISSFSPRIIELAEEPHYASQELFM